MRTAGIKSQMVCLIDESLVRMSMSRQQIRQISTSIRKARPRAASTSSQKVNSQKLTPMLGSTSLLCLPDIQSLPLSKTSRPMPLTPIIVRTVPALRRTVDGFRARKARIALVPTMGALHEGHMSLVRLAKRRADKVVVSIFVNPTQFAPTEDFGSYPRTWKNDLAKLKAENTDVVWHPDVKTMYPDGFATRIVPEGPASAGLEDRFRPHFFAGVATVVGKLFTQVRPDVAIFGEKDFQQLKVVTRMAADLDLGVKVIGSKTIRELDGLAMSSRNVHLSAEQRRAAVELYRAMRQTAGLLRGGKDIAAALAAGIAILTSAGFVLDYFEVRHAETLAAVASPKDGPLRILVAARLGEVRLIDNIGI